MKPPSPTLPPPAETAAPRPLNQRPHTTLSGVPLEPLYTAADLPADFDLPLPGQPPYVRGIHANMYRGKLWTMRQFSGFASAEQTNERYRHLLAQGQTGLSVAFDLPTLMGRDSDDPLSAGEVGKCGVAIDSVEDMEILFRGIPLDAVTTSMTINSPASVIWAMFIVAAERQGVATAQLAGTLQNDILKEYIAQKEYLYPPAPSMRLVVDSVAYGMREVPRFHPISISGYHIREAGSTALQELAFTLRDGMEYVEYCLRRGLPVDGFAPRLSFFFNAHSDFFEEIAKYRAARKLWHAVMTTRYGAREARSTQLRFHTQTAGVSLTAQQPYNNVVRVALQALAAVLGGTQSLHTNSLDEALALPTAEAATLALRTQQILAYESGVAEVADPLGGSYLLERLTLDLERGAYEYFERIDGMGGMVPAIEQGFPQREIADAAYRYQQALDRGDKIMVGVNAYQVEEPPVPILYIDESTGERQSARLAELRRRRSNAACTAALDHLRRVAAGDDNTMPAILDCVRASCTLGEICAALGDVFGAWEETPVT